MSELLEESLQVLLIFHLHRLVKTPPRYLIHTRLGVSVYDTYVVKTVGAFPPEVLDQKVALMLLGIRRL